MAGQSDPFLTERVLQLRLDHAQAATRKYNSIADKAHDGRMKETLQVWGASRTGRWAGRNLQLQNLKRSPPNAEFLSDLVANDPETARALLTLEDLGSCVRGAIKASPGKRLVVADLSSIEVVVLGWMTGCRAINQAVAEGKDIYKAFASTWFARPYEDITKAQRTISKPAVLGCFARETLLLTDTGWKPIIRIQKQDKLWDGESWVTHQGVVYQGIQAVITKKGLRATANHPILTAHNKWEKWGDLTEGSYRKAISLASGLCSGTTGGIGSAGAPVGSWLGSQLTTSPGASPGLVLLAPIVRRLNLVAIWQKLSAYLADTLPVCRTGFMPSAVDAQTPRTPGSPITGGAGLSACSHPQRRRFGTLLRYLGGTTPVPRLTESITRATTNPATFGSLIAAGMLQIPESTESFSTKGNDIPRAPFGGNALLAIETPGLWLARFGKVFRRRKLSLIRPNAEAPTYDVLEAGPNNRFTVWSDEGPLLVHNSGYGMGRVGLKKYAESMGIPMTEDEAASATNTYRSTHPEVCKAWRVCEETFKLAVQHPGTPFGKQNQVVYKTPFLRWRLPSGRELFYFRPEVDEDGRRSYMGQNQYTNKWQRIETWGGKIIENLVQAISRDVLVEGLWSYHRAGGTIIGHVHDEILAEEFESDAEQWLETLIHCMSEPIDWAPGMKLGAAGYTARRYRKD